MSRWEFGRRERWSFELLDDRDRRVGWLGGELGGVSDAQLDINSDASVRTSGTLSFWQQMDAPRVDWALVRVRPILTIRAGGTTTHHPHSLLMVDPTVTLTGTGRLTELALLDKTPLLDTKLEESKSLPAGTNAVAAAIDVIRQVDPHGALSIPGSPKVLAFPQAWESDGQNTLRLVVNDLLAYAGYWSVHLNLEGQWDARPYVDAAQRGESWRLEAGERSIFAGDIPVDYDFFRTPNRWTCRSRADGETAPLVSVATNDNPASPTSTVRRRRVIPEVEVDVEAADQAALDAITRRRLTDRTPGRTYAVDHAWIPIVEHDRLHLGWERHGLDVDVTLVKRRIECRAGALVRSEFREVLAL